MNTSPIFAGGSTIQRLIAQAIWQLIQRLESLRAIDFSYGNAVLSIKITDCRLEARPLSASAKRATLNSGYQHIEHVHRINDEAIKDESNT